jgi:1-acyl-sn-glycerol-3-phosphate acyltransferase
MLAMTVAALMFAPFIIVGTIAWDALRLQRKLPTLRMYLFACQYLLNDSAEILAAGPLWIATGGGHASRRRYQRIQAWSIDVLARRAERLLGIRLDVRVPSIDTLVAPPTILVCRHVSIFDTAVPSLLCQRAGYDTSGVITAEALADPGFDLLYQHTGSVFIARDNDPAARDQITAFARNLHPGTVAVIFPEGRFFRPEVMQRSLARLAERDPQRAHRLAGLRHVLPPRPAGLNAILDALPDADVVAINHAGFDRYPTLAQLARHVPLDQPIAVDVRRIPRAEIPDDPAQRTAWLDNLWCDMDRWVDGQLD